MQKIFNFNELEDSDLIVDAIYKGGTAGNISDDPIHKIIGCGNSGGIRILGSSCTTNIKLVTLYSSLSEPDWPDRLDEQTGIFTYYGDNKHPGHILHDTPKKGNVIVRFSS